MKIYTQARIRKLSLFPLCHLESKKVKSVENVLLYHKRIGLISGLTQLRKRWEQDNVGLLDDTKRKQIYKEKVVFSNETGPGMRVSKVSLSIRIVICTSCCLQDAQNQKRHPRQSSHQSRLLLTSLSKSRSIIRSIIGWRQRN